MRRKASDQPEPGSRKCVDRSPLACGDHPVPEFVRRSPTNTPKRGGTLTFMIPADSPPSFDGHRENTFATIHAVAPFYSVLIRANPENPADTTEFVCDVCTEIPDADGWRPDLRIPDPRRCQVPGRLAHDRLRRGGELEQDRRSAGRRDQRASRLLFDDRQDRGARRENRRLPPQVRDRRVSAGARRSIRLHLQEGDPRPRPALVREEHHGLRSVPLQGISGGTVDFRRAQSRLLPTGTALSGWLHRHFRRQAGGAGRRDQGRPGGDRVPRLSAGDARRACGRARRQDHRAGERLELRGAGHAEPCEKAVRRRAGCAAP